MTATLNEPVFDAIKTELYVYYIFFSENYRCFGIFLVAWYFQYYG